MVTLQLMSKVTSKHCLTLLPFKPLFRLFSSTRLEKIASIFSINCSQSVDVSSRYSIFVVLFYYAELVQAFYNQSSLDVVEKQTPVIFEITSANMVQDQTGEVIFYF